jgi:hypothetical protein
MAAGYKWSQSLAQAQEDCLRANQVYRYCTMAVGGPHIVVECDVPVWRPVAAECLVHQEPEVRGMTSDAQGRCGFKYMDYYCSLAPHAGNDHYDSAEGRRFTIVVEKGREVCYSI